MITPADIDTCLSSQLAQTARESLKDKCDTLTQRAFCTARDYLLLRLLQSNAQRPAAVRAITPNVLSKALVQQDGVALMVGCCMVGFILLFFHF